MTPAKVSAIDLIAAERQRQISEEGWTPEHDDDVHARGDLLSAAVAYCEAVRRQIYDKNPDLNHVRAMYWPWNSASWKPSEDPQRNLVKAAALLAAEIDRRERTRTAS